MIAYLLHFDRPISQKHAAQHYIGVCENLKKRIGEHRRGEYRRAGYYNGKHRNAAGARFTQVAWERGITFVVARTWEKADRQLERRLKNRHGVNLCPICQEQKRIEEFTSLDQVEEMEF